MFFRNKRFLSIFMSFVLVFAIVIGVVPAPVSAAEEATLTIVHTNDIHGRINYVAAGERDPSIGHAKFKTFVEDLRAKGNVLLLDAGDVLHGTPEINVSDGKTMVEYMNLLGVDAMAPGNHDFNYGYKRLLELDKMADFPILAANIAYEKDGKAFLKPYTIKEYDGFKVGIFGLGTEETKVKSHPNNTKGLKFTDYYKAAEESVAALKKEGVDLIVGLFHVGLDEETKVKSKDIAKKVKGIDVIVDGHSHDTLEEGLLVEDTLIVQTGNYLQNIGLVEVKLGKDIEKKASLLTVEKAADIEANKALADEIEKLKEENEKITSKVIGSSKVDLVGNREVVRTGESTLGNLITDAMLYAMPDADVAFTNGGGIRASIAKGDITLGNVLEAFPFTNFLCSIEVTGEEIVQAIEHGIKDYPGEAGGFPHVAGMKYSFDPEKPVGEKVTKVLVGGKNIDLKKKYVLVTNDFMAVGGDGYTMFGGKKILAQGALFSDILADYLIAKGEVNPKVEGRIVVGELEEEKPLVKKYKVVKGDVLWKIARKYNTTWQKLAEYNKLKNPHLIFPNQIILIP